jgi:hypothetical protein
VTGQMMLTGGKAGYGEQTLMLNGKMDLERAIDADRTDDADEDAFRRVVDIQ